jgi:flagellar biosynthesis/type III secretory pathway chaperone
MPLHMVVSTTDRLRQLLCEEEATCRQLLETVYEERTAIRTVDITRFHDINCRRLSILEVLETIADARHRLVQELARLHGLSQDTSLHQLVDHLRTTSPELLACYQGYLTQAKTVRDEIKHNAGLIEGIRGVINQALSVGSPLGEGHELYTAGGQSVAVGRTNVLIHQ